MRYSIPALIVLSCLSVPSVAEVKLAAVFCDNMVLQQDSPIRVWGWAAPGEAVTVTLGKQSGQTKADDKGDWSVELKPLRATGEAMELTVAGKNTITIKNVLVGEVWVCSGQSNMAFCLGESQNARQEVRESDYPQIRMFTVENIPAPVPARDVKGKWDVSTPQTSGRFSAVGYFFARALHKDLKVPVGMINSSWGGTAAEPWTSREGLAHIPWLQKTLKEYDAYTKDFSGALDDAKYRELGGKMMEKWFATHRHADPGNKGFALGYAKGDFDDKDWKEIELPQMFQAAGYKCNGAFWVRKVIDLPKSAEGKDLELNLGSIDDFDTAYFNGVQVGATGRETENAWTVHRWYVVPGKLVQAGRNVVAVRVFDWSGGGGFNPRTGDEIVRLLLGAKKAGCRRRSHWSGPGKSTSRRNCPTWSSSCRPEPMPPVRACTTA